MVAGDVAVSGMVLFPLSMLLAVYEAFWLSSSTAFCDAATAAVTAMVTVAR